MIFANTWVFEKLEMCFIPKHSTLKHTHTHFGKDFVHVVHLLAVNSSKLCCVRTIGFSTCHLSCSKKAPQSLFS